MATTLIRNAQAIVTVDREDRVLRGENILVQDNVIRYIGPEERPADRVIDASHCFVYPGLVNTHHHLYQTFTRNLPKVQKMELFPWLRTLYEIWRGLDEDCIYYSSLVGLGELLKYGCTTCMDHHYVFPRVGSEHFIDQQFRAADLLGGPVPRHPGAVCPGAKATAVCRRTTWCRMWTPSCGTARDWWRNSTIHPGFPCTRWPWPPARPSA